MLRVSVPEGGFRAEEAAALVEASGLVELFEGKAPGPFGPSALGLRALEALGQAVDIGWAARQAVRGLIVEHLEGGPSFRVPRLERRTGSSCRPASSSRRWTCGGVGSGRSWRWSRRRGSSSSRGCPICSGPSSRPPSCLGECWGWRRPGGEGTSRSMGEPRRRPGPSWPPGSGRSGSCCAGRCCGFVSRPSCARWRARSRPRGSRLPATPMRVAHPGGARRAGLGAAGGGARGHRGQRGVSAGGDAPGPGRGRVRSGGGPQPQAGQPDPVRPGRAGVRQDGHGARGGPLLSGVLPRAPDPGALPDHPAHRLGLELSERQRDEPGPDLSRAGPRLRGRVRGVLARHRHRVRLAPERAAALGGEAEPGGGLRGLRRDALAARWLLVLAL